MASRALQRAGNRPVLWSLAGHGLLVLLMLVNLPSFRFGGSQPVRLAIDAVVVPDVAAVRERERDAERRRELERQRQEEARQAELERQRKLEEQQKAEQQRQAEERKKAEQERIALEKRRQEEQQRKEAEAKRKAEAQRKAEEQRRQAEQEKQRKEQERRAADERRRQEAREAELAAALAAEQQREDAVRSGELDIWVEAIRQKVVRNWVKPPGAGQGIECEVRVAQIPGGDVVDVRVGRCNGDAVVVRSIENAVYRASPLPMPADAALFERNITFIFIPAD